MRSSVYTLDPNGYLDVGCGGAGGFRILPQGGNPGPLPVNVYLDQVQDPKSIGDSAPVYLAPGTTLSRLEVKGGTPGATYLVTILEPGEKMGAAAGSRRPTRISVLAAVALTNVAPAVAGDGFAVPDSWAGGTLRLVARDVVNARSIRKWIQGSGGTWFPAGALDPTDPANDCTRELAIYASAQRLYFQITDAFGALNVDVDVEVPL